MACILVVDENDWPRQVLSQVLHRAGHETLQARDLAEVRSLGRSSGRPSSAQGPGASIRPALSLVELVRENGNGFSVAAWLQAQGYGAVVLLSERGDAADTLWAQARGIAWTLSRGAGPAVFCDQLNRILRAAAQIPGGEGSCE